MKKKTSYGLTLTNVTRLEDVASVRLSKGAWLLAVTLAAIVLMAIGALLMVFSPLRDLLPASMKPSERETAVENLLTLDSLKRLADANEVYMMALRQALDTEREPALPDTLGTELAATPALMSAGQRERRFVAEMRQRDRLNLSTLTETPQGISFSEIAPASIATEASRDSLVMQLIVPAGVPIMAVAEGTVVGVFNAGTPRKVDYSLIIQHPKGYLSRYSGLPVPLVGQGASIVASQPLALSDGNHTLLDIELWQNGARLVPGRYLGY